MGGVRRRRRERVVQDLHSVGFLFLSLVLLKKQQYVTTAPSFCKPDRSDMIVGKRFTQNY